MIQLIIPAAGNGQRFKDAGYKEPKPMIDVLGKPMVWRVIENVRPAHSNVIVITRSGQNVELPTGCENVRLDHETEGAVSTLLEAEHLIKEDTTLLIANCDQLVDFDAVDFVDTDLDGRIVVFRSSNPHHSYVTVKDDVVMAIAEKEVISAHAVTGVYYFKSAKAFFDAAHKVIAKGKKTKGEFYVSTVIDELIWSGKQFSIYEADSTMLGTPEELQHFLVAAKVAKTL